MHGARGGAPEGAANGAWRHGARTKKAEQLQRETSALIRLWTKLQKQF